jgi:hypothetical protein
MTMAQLRTILERGLITGKWSIQQFNKKAREPVLPGREFLEENPKFLDMSFRDMDAFRNSNHKGYL